MDLPQALVGRGTQKPGQGHPQATAGQSQGLVPSLCSMAACREAGTSLGTIQRAPEPQEGQLGTRALRLSCGHRAGSTVTAGHLRSLSFRGSWGRGGHCCSEPDVPPWDRHVIPTRRFKSRGWGPSGNTTG